MIAHRIGFCVASLRCPLLSYHIHEPTPHAALAVASRRRPTGVTRAMAALFPSQSSGEGRHPRPVTNRFEVYPHDPSCTGKFVYGEALLSARQTGWDAQAGPGRVPSWPKATKGRPRVLAHAYAQCRSNKGAPGVDRQDFEAVEEYGVERWLGELALALRQETYRPEPIRRVYIPKANGKLRPLGISTLRDRVCMTAAMLVLEPIFEADLPSELYAYRPGRNAQQAVVEVEELLFRGHPDVVDADLADYFGSIPHADLLKSAARRIVDRRVLHLIRMWLDCPVEETDDRGRKTRTTGARDKRRGIPQGSPLSPLLANIYMRRFVLGWKTLGLERTLGTRLVIYADDLVILCRRGKAEAALQRLREIMGKLKLTVNEEKTRICKVPEGEFDFLGYTFGRMYSARTGKARIGYRPSKKSVQRAVEKIHALTDRSGTWQETTTRWWAK